MDIKNIFVVVAPDYTEDDVRKILIEDGYDDNFVFGSKYPKNSTDWEPVMLQCDEVWVFGKSYRTFGVAKWQHAYANKNGMDVWNMG